jgi:hypothetical protein
VQGPIIARTASPVAARIVRPRSTGRVSTTIVGGRRPATAAGQGGRGVVLIFGFGQGQGQDLGEVAPIACPNCHNEVFLHHVHSDRKFSLFFVPVATYATNEYLLCPVCTRGIQLSDAQRSQVAAMRSATDAHRGGRVADDLYRIEVEQFWARMGIRASPAAPGAPRAVSPPPAPTRAAIPAPVRAAPARPVPAAPPQQAAKRTPSLTDELAGLAELHRTGILTDAEFAAAKDRLLRS